MAKKKNNLRKGAGDHLCRAIVWFNREVCAEITIGMPSGDTEIKVTGVDNNGDPVELEGSVTLTGGGDDRTSNKVGTGQAGYMTLLS